ncbi:F-box and associated interaction domains-containing protein [Prunus dulcis]|uniref:F-box and associated interaction domains-containing protein n=1 Tax=Prunus dulcis TaxID=3755 RepID=A0A4Y1RBJ6_PRUDU|nr:F-box and associated interaction domains-containing protein [Prunus dulcis]
MGLVYNYLNLQDMDNIQDITQRIHELKFEAMAHAFPEEIIQEILIRLSVKSLIKCTSVCKAWRSMIINKALFMPTSTQQWTLITRMTLTSSYSTEFLVAIASTTTKTRSLQGERRGSLCAS